MEMDKRYWFVFFLPALLFLLYLSAGFHRWFAFTASTPGSVPKQVEMVRAELQSIALLQQQADGLLRLWNATSNSSDGEMLKGEIMAQIRLNREAQQMLLSSHQNRSALGAGSRAYYSLDAGSSASTCRVVDTVKHAVKNGYRWQPNANNYLLAVCTSGQFSNHLICIEKHMFFAALLNRTLVLPNSKVDYSYERVLNISHIQDCFAGNSTVITFDDFRIIRKGNLFVNRFLCYMHDCYLDKDHEDALNRVGVTWGKKEDAWSEAANEKAPSRLDAAQFISKFACDDEVIGIGDVFYANVEEKLLKQTGGPLSHTCQSIIKPHSFILAAAERFIQTFLGRNFIALHFRRYGFLTFCNENSKKGQNCFFYPIPQAADCILRKVKSLTASVIYLSTDAQESETALLQSLLVESGTIIPLVQRPMHEKGEKWDSPLARHGVLSDKEVIAMLDKTICAMSATFIGTPGSTFTDDIMRMRREWGTSSTCDEFLCQGEKPNFIAGLH